jgi:hypothetical protein
MIPMRSSMIFKSRWMALVWAAGIIWFAYDFAGSQSDQQNAGSNSAEASDATGAPVTSDDAKKLAQELNSF